MILNEYNSIYPWGDKRRFNSYASYIKRTFGERIQKLSVNAGFTCPNRDGTVGVGGCTYCNNESFSPGYCDPSKPIAQQLHEGMRFHSLRYRRVKRYMAYFQAYSNTYAPLSHLKEVYQQALAVEHIVGLAIGTRPDCVDEEKLDYLASLATNHYVSLEFGVEACNDALLNAINRGHTFRRSAWAIEQAAQRGLNVGAHFIIGLPGQSINDIIAQVDTINSLPLTSIKFHQLQIVSNTQIARQYEENPSSFHFLSADDYLLTMVKVVEKLNPAVAIERISGEASPRTMLAPNWGKARADKLLLEFEGLLENKDTWQGRLYM